MSGSVEFDLEPLHKFISSITTTKYVKVGIFGSNKTRKNKNGKGRASQNNVMVGARHEYGTSRLPVRSFLRMPLATKAAQIVKVVSIGAVELLAAGKIDKLLDQLGVVAEGVIQAAFASGGFGTWKDIAESTKRRKHSDAILIETRQLRRSIDHAVVDK